MTYGRRRARRRLAMIGVAGILAGVGALGLGSAGFAAPKPPKPDKPKHPANIHVACSSAALIAAIDTANANGGGTLDLAHHCTYLLTTANNTGPLGSNGLPVVTSQIVVKGHDSTIAGNNTNFRIFQVDAPNGNLTLDHVTLTGGHAVQGAGMGPSGAGGALFNNEGTVSVKHSVVTGNTADMAGGGLASAGALTVDHSLVSQNTVTGEEGGGGGIVNRAGTLTVTHSRITGNTAPGGGGIATGPGNPSGTGSLTTIDHSKIDHNTVNASEESGGGGIANGGQLVVRHSEISDNNAPGLFGGGLLNHGSSATLDHTKVKGNTAATGGGIANLDFGSGAQLTLTHSDVTHNTATADGGGIFNGGGTVTLHKSHVHANTPDNCAPPASVPGCTG